MPWELYSQLQDYLIISCHKLPHVIMTLLEDDVAIDQD